VRENGNHNGPEYTTINEYPEFTDAIAQLPDERAGEDAYRSRHHEDNRQDRLGDADVMHEKGAGVRHQQEPAGG